jgi:hypothetical protein
MARATMPQTAAVATALAEAEHASVRARQITYAAADVFQGRRAGQENGRDRASARREPPPWRCAARGVTCAFDLSPNLWPIEADEVQLVRYSRTC